MRNDMKDDGGTKRYTKDAKDWSGKNTMPMSTTNVPQGKNYQKSKLWCKSCGRGPRTCKCNQDENN
jgi:hypothetical protein